MNPTQMDERVIKKIAGPAWDRLRPSFEVICENLLQVDPEAQGALTTIYVKFTSPKTAGQPYAVLWLRKSSELILGLALPDEWASTFFIDAPKGCKYAGLTKYLIIRPSEAVPDELEQWCQNAYEAVTETCGQ